MSRIRLIIVLALIFLLGIGASLMVYQSAQRVIQSSHDLVERALADLQAIASFKSDLAEHERLAYELYAVIDADQFRSVLLQKREHMESGISRLPGLGMGDDEIQSVIQGWQVITSEVDDLLDNIDGRLTDWDGARSQLQTIRDERRQVKPLLDDLVLTAERRAQQADRRNRDQLNLMSSMVMVYTFVIMAIAAATGWLLRRLFTTNETARALAQFPARNPMPVLTVDHSGHVGYANKAAREFTHQQLGADSSVDELIPAPVLQALRESLINRRYGKLESPLQRQMLAYHWYWLPDRGIFHVYIRDITAERAAEDQLRRMAYEDQVTGLMNREAIVGNLQRLIDHKSGICLVLLSIDRFHLLPPTVGFDGADRVLRKLGQSIDDRARKLIGPSVSVARLEGALFALCWADGGSDQERDQLLVSLMDALPEIVRSGRVVFRARYRMGVKHASAGSSLSGERVFSDADAALRASERKTGCRYVVHDESIQDREQGILTIEQRLRRTIHGKANGLELHLQPKVALAGEAVVGAEALIRWHDQELGQVPPDRFIAIAEQSGLIISLGRWVIDKTIEILAQWRDDPVLSRLHLAVNASAEELEVNDYATFILNRLQQEHVPPDHFEIEVTERVLADTASINRIDTLGRLRRAGVNISVDDFGTGYSSLAYLSALPISHIKIDKIFVDDVPPVHKAALAKIIVDLARELELSCVAEGVESREQADYLRSIGCQLAQGYFFARPGLRKDFEAMVRTWGVAA